MKKKEEALEKEQWTAAAWDMLYLVQCGINSVVPDPERVAKMDLEKVYARSKSQSLEVLTYMALESLMQSNPEIQISDEKQVLPQWKEAKNKAIAKNLMMDAAREQLFAFMEEQGIWHMILKGPVLCHMYPKYGMRQMADNDILFDPSFRQEIHDWFVEQGYKVKKFQESNHDVYLKKPVYNFEMHIALFSQDSKAVFSNYYDTVKTRLLVVPGKNFEYYMTDEDFYLYILSHEYKHYFNSGIGLRSLLDLYIFNKVKNGTDRGYLDEELNKLGLINFENQIRNLALKTFAPHWEIDSFSDQEWTELKELIFGSAFGTRQKYWRNNIRKLQMDGDGKAVGVKWKYLMNRLFPDRGYMEKWCEQYAPYFLKHKCLMPLARFWRIIKRIVKRRKRIRDELDTIRKV